MIGRFYKSHNCYNREENEGFRMCRPWKNQSDRTCIKITFRILPKTLENKAKYFIRKTQFGFRKNVER